MHPSVQPSHGQSTSVLIQHLISKQLYTLKRYVRVSLIESLDSRPFRRVGAQSEYEVESPKLFLKLSQTSNKYPIFQNWSSMNVLLKINPLLPYKLHTKIQKSSEFRKRNSHATLLALPGNCSPGQKLENLEMTSF